LEKIKKGGHMKSTIKITSFICLIMIVFLSCSGRFEKKETYWDNGEIRERWTEKALEEGKSVKHGQYTQWHSNGQKAVEGKFVDGVKHGKQQTWYSNGQIAVEGKFVDGVKHGKHQTWYSNGQMEEEKNFVKGVIHGRYAQWYQNGQKQLECNAVDGSSKYSQWYKNGNKELEGELVDGATHGFWTRFYRNGQEWIQSNWENGKFKGNISIWNDADNIRKDFVLVKSEYQLEGNDTKIQFWNIKVGFNFCKTYQIRITEGRYFSKIFDTPEEKIVMISQDAVNILGKPFGYVTGKRLSNGSRIIGVISDFSYLARMTFSLPGSRQDQIPLVLILSPEESH
jgi:antitoxin component YwqK of YwqJK toxin-antitoxin module